MGSTEGGPGEEATFEAFWEASSLTPATAPAFGARITAFTPREEPRLATYPGADVALPMPGDRLARLLRRRQSGRAFGPAPLTMRQLGSLLAAVATNERGTRVYPSAGGLYPLEVYCLLERVSGGPGRCVACYNPDNHSLSRVADLPPWDDYQATLNIPLEGTPALAVVFVAFPEVLFAKYGARAGRFALVEVGHAAQNLLLRLAEEDLAGCEVGGVLDQAMIRLLRLGGTGAHVALAVVCGHR